MKQEFDPVREAVNEILTESAMYCLKQYMFGKVGQVYVEPDKVFHKITSQFVDKTTGEVYFESSRAIPIIAA